VLGRLAAWSRRCVQLAGNRAAADKVYRVLLSGMIALPALQNRATQHLYRLLQEALEPVAGMAEPLRMGALVVLHRERVLKVSVQAGWHGRLKDGRNYVSGGLFVGPVAVRRARCLKAHASDSSPGSGVLVVALTISAKESQLNILVG